MFPTSKSTVAALTFVLAISGIRGARAAESTESIQKQNQAPAISNSAALVVVSHVDAMPPFTNSLRTMDERMR